MIATERVINDLNVAKLMLCNPQVLTPEMFVKIGQAITSTIVLLKEQDNQIEQLEHDLAVTQNNLNYYVNGND